MENATKDPIPEPASLNTCNAPPLLPRCFLGVDLLLPARKITCKLFERLVADPKCCRPGLWAISGKPSGSARGKLFIILGT